MKTRMTVLLAAMVATAVAMPAQAAPKKPAPKPKPKPTCNLVIDATGDTKYALVSVQVGALDVKSADIASNGKIVSATIRLADLDAQDAGLAVAKRYRVMWRGQGGKLLYAFSADIPLAGAASYAYGTAERSQTFVPFGVANGVVDKAADEIRVWANISDMVKMKDTGSLKVGAKQNEVMAESFTSNGWHFDSGTSDAKSIYYVGNPSCAKVGS